MIYTLTEIREMQLHCIKQLIELIKSNPKCVRFIGSCEEEIVWRKHVFNNPKEVQI
jgi:hypothetical protein